MFHNLKATAPASIDEYITGFPVEIQNILRQVRAVVHQNAPGALEAMAYGMPTFRLEGNLVHFAAYPNHIGFYPAPSGILKFAGALKKYRSGKGSVQFPLDQPIPYQLIAEIVRFRVEEQRNSKKRK